MRDQHLRFADDLVLLTSSEQDFQHAFVGQHALCFGKASLHQPVQCLSYFRKRKNNKRWQNCEKSDKTATKKCYSVFSKNLRHVLAKPISFQIRSRKFQTTLGG